MKMLAASIAASLLAVTSYSADPDFGPNVILFRSGQEGMQEQINAVFQKQERAQFGSSRYALLFRPGRYEVDVPVRFFTHVAGLGNLPAEVTIAGRVWTNAAWMNRNATCNFWPTTRAAKSSPARKRR